MSIDAAFTELPTLKTPRLILRQLRPTDSHALFDLLSDPVVGQYGSSPLHQSLEDTQAFIQRMQDSYERQERLNWGITSTGDDTVIGMCGFHHFSAGFRCVETGYKLHQAHWGNGLITEAMSSVLEYGFMTLNCHRIEAVIDETNTRSKRVLLKLGFRYEATLRQRFFIRNHFEDETYYGLLKTEWLESPLHAQLMTSNNAFT